MDLIAALRQILSGVDDTEYPYYHVSEHPEPPTIRDSGGLKHDDPNGIYLFVKGKEVEQEGWKPKKYRWDAKLKVDFDNIDHFPFDEWLTELGVSDPLDYVRKLSVKRIGDKPLNHFQEDVETFYENNQDEDDEHIKIAAEHGYILLKHVLGRAKLTSFLRKKGIKAFGDTSEHLDNQIWPGEPQIIVLDPSVIEWGPREENVPDNEVYIMAALKRIVTP